MKPHRVPHHPAGSVARYGATLADDQFSPQSRVVIFEIIAGIRIAISRARLITLALLATRNPLLRRWRRRIRRRRLTQPVRVGHGRRRLDGRIATAAGQAAAAQRQGGQQ